MSEKISPEKFSFLGKIWKQGSNLAIGIPKDQNAKFSKLRKKTLRITVEVIDP